MKFALLSPYFTYFETMPSKNSKDFVNITLTRSLASINVFLKQVASESDHEPEMKRQKMEQTKDLLPGDKYSQVAEACRTLQK